MAKVVLGERLRIGLDVCYVAYTSESDPLALPLVTLTDGTKTVVFQGMVHVGSESFYTSVVYDLERAMADGYVLFYEGVQSSDPAWKVVSTRWVRAMRHPEHIEGELDIEG